MNEGELEDLAALAESRPLQVRFIEMMPIGYGAAMPCISGPELRERFARRWPEFSPLPAAQSAGSATGLPSTTLSRAGRAMWASSRRSTASSVLPATGCG